MGNEIRRMIIWINGANGVGKSHVAAKLAEHLEDRNAEYVELDLYQMEFIRKDFLKAFSGFNPYCNKYFLSIFRNELEKKIQNLGKIPIVSMSLVDKLCEKELFDYFEEKDFSMIHIILEAKKETIISRIENDPVRNEEEQSEQKNNVNWQIQYLEREYPNAVRINTEDKSLSEIVDEIMLLYNT